MKLTLQSPYQLPAFIEGLRQNVGYTQKEAGALLGISQQAYQKIERQPERVSFERIMQIIKLFNGAIEIDSNVDPEFKKQDVTFDLPDKKNNEPPKSNQAERKAELAKQRAKRLLDIRLQAARKRRAALRKRPDIKVTEITVGGGAWRHAMITSDTQIQVRDVSKTHRSSKSDSSVILVTPSGKKANW